MHPTRADGYYCYNRFNATEVDYWCYKKNQDDHTCSEVTPTQMSDFSSNFGKCIKRAADLGLNIAINARVDDGRSLGGEGGGGILERQMRFGQLHRCLQKKL